MTELKLRTILSPGLVAIWACVSGCNTTVVSDKPTNGSGRLGECPGSYVGYALITPNSGGLWNLPAGQQVYDGTTNSANTVIYYQKGAVSGCSQNSSPAKLPAGSYSLRIYFKTPTYNPALGYPISFNPSVNQ